MNGGLNAGGWSVMLISLAFVWGLTFWCFYRVLTAPPEEEIKEPTVGLGA